MGEVWNPPIVLKKHFPFEVAAVDAMMYLAENAGPFNGAGVLQRMRGGLLECLYQTLAPHCERTECTLCATEKEAYYDIDMRTGELLPRLVFHHGNPNAKIMFAGEGPGLGERSSYVPFCGTGEVLESRCITCEDFETCFRTII